MEADRQRRPEERHRVNNTRMEHDRIHMDDVEAPPNGFKQLLETTVLCMKLCLDLQVECSQIKSLTSQISFGSEISGNAIRMGGKKIFCNTVFEKINKKGMCNWRQHRVMGCHDNKYMMCACVQSLDNQRLMSKKDVRR